MIMEQTLDKKRKEGSAGSTKGKTYKVRRHERRDH